ncbi:MAG: histidine phosphatase family protein [Candidatus Thorarchaeota archaeon]|jgi:probable phosphoglycerate mutase
MRILLVRHGQSTDNVTGTISGLSAPLSDIGKEQAKSLGQSLLEIVVKIDAVYASDMRRASETATIICNEIGVEEIIFDMRLREGDAGILTGKRFDELTKEERAIFDSHLVNLDEKLPGGESNNEQMMRTKEAFFEIVENHPEDSTLLIVGHGGTLYHILKRTLDILPETDEWFGNCMLNIIERDSYSSTWNLTMFNNNKLVT